MAERIMVGAFLVGVPTATLLAFGWLTGWAIHG